MPLECKIGDLVARDVRNVGDHCNHSKKKNNKKLLDKSYVCTS